MPNEIAKIETPDAQYYAADEKPTLEARVYELEKQISGLKHSESVSNAWADRWAKEQVRLGMIIKGLNENMLSHEEVKQFRTFIEDFNKVFGDKNA